MASEATLAAGAANRDLPDEAPGPFQDCHDVVHIAIFFDGTGNNREADLPIKSWSNVGRMYDAALKDESKAIYPIYVSGVGTAYNGKAGNWLHSTGVWLEDNVGGAGAGAGGARRLGQGDDAVSDALAKVLIANAKAQGGEVAKYAASSTDKGFAELNTALSKHRLIKVINMSFFGFSRGAALARAFSNRVIGYCKPQGQGLAYHGYPMRFNFLGIFDTVASFGVPSQNVRLPFEERELIVSPRVERCVHYVAAHEVRFSFPVDLIRKNGKLAGEWVESVYPGVHSDVGGGYEPNAQGIDNNYARIPMRDMMRESVTSGVRIMSYAQVEKSRATLFKERFECHQGTEQAYRDYMAACGLLSGAVENQIRRHLEVFYSANGTMDRKGIETPGQRRLHEAKYKYIGPKGMAWEVDKYRLAVKVDSWVRFGNGANGFAQYVKPEDWQLAAWDKNASDGVVNFVSHYIHDSKVDFIGNLAEPFSYFRPRGVQESTVSIWTEWGNWMGSKRDAATKAVTDTYEAGKKKAGEAVDATTKAAKDAAAAAQKKAEDAAAYAQRKAEEAAHYARQKADEAAAAAKRGYDATAKAASDLATAAQQRAHDAGVYAQSKAQAAMKAAGNAYDATAKAGKSAAAAGSKKLGEIEDGAERLYDQGMNWIKRKAKDAGF
ncbi:hypothetical protein ASF61_22280 [Duganella sp. Leaf126]|uniref:T6SS phospholipase effector Tle1-like catalytic domain-containing protein n=1 Tax=Duganella sp. Leaf126 TaxID=1736266 RepID=UPI0006FB445F|nr:DUF2235 domain-containing protein [Duganella sp. Leaf126]KQQ39191.1 hypothetical protein ASF61_22280 [Duganella sp. Leaf126]